MPLTSTRLRREGMELMSVPVLASTNSAAPANPLPGLGFAAPMMDCKLGIPFQSSERRGRMHFTLNLCHCLASVQPISTFPYGVDIEKICKLIGIAGQWFCHAYLLCNWTIYEHFFQQGKLGTDSKLFPLPHSHRILPTFNLGRKSRASRCLLDELPTLICKRPTDDISDKPRKARLP